jgi:hypothetical protein
VLTLTISTLFSTLTIFTLLSSPCSKILLNDLDPLSKFFFLILVELRHFHTATYGSSTAGVRTKCMFSMLFSKYRNILLMHSAEGI